MTTTETQTATSPLLTFAVFILGGLALIIAAVSGGSFTKIQRLKPPGVITNPDRPYYPSLPPTPDPKNPDAKDSNFAKRTVNYTEKDFQELERVRKMKIGDVSKQHEIIGFSILAICRILIGLFIAVAVFFPRFISRIACANSFLCLLGLGVLTRLLFVRDATFPDVTTSGFFNALGLISLMFFYFIQRLLCPENGVESCGASPLAESEIEGPENDNVASPQPTPAPASKSATSTSEAKSDLVVLFATGMAFFACALISLLALSMVTWEDKIISLGPSSMLTMGIAGLTALWSLGLPFVFSTFRWNHTNARTFGVSTATLLALAAIFFLR